MRVLAWIAPGTWEAVVEAARNRPSGDEITLLAVADEAEMMPRGLAAGLMGRGRPTHDEHAGQLSADAAQALLGQAGQALGRDCHQRVLTGRTERVVTAACGQADLLLLARDGDRSRLGPHSLGRHTRFVLDHAPCTVALLWPGQTPSLDSIPAPPHP